VPRNIDTRRCRCARYVDVDARTRYHCTGSLLPAVLVVVAMSHDDFNVAVSMHQVKSHTLVLPVAALEISWCALPGLGLLLTLEIVGIYGVNLEAGMWRVPCALRMLFNHPDARWHACAPERRPVGRHRTALWLRGPCTKFAAARCDLSMHAWTTGAM
jgi:hypothetical protein